MDFDADFDVTEPQDIIVPEAEPIAKPVESISKNYQGMLFLWIMFCVFSFSWFVKKLFRGRTKMRTDFVTIEEQLKRLQMSLENKEKVANAEKFDGAISKLTNMTALDPVPEQQGGAQDGERDEVEVEINGNEQEEAQEKEEDFNVIEDNVEQASENDLEEKKNL